MKIVFVGNCQTASLCFYFQQLLGDQSSVWLLYDNDFLQFYGPWLDKVNKRLDVESIFQELKQCDVVVYQEITKEKSLFCNTPSLKSLTKESCQLVKIPSICFEYDTYDVSLQELIKREDEKEVNVRVSDMFERYKDRCLMLTLWHPNTFLFLEVVNALCKLLNIATFSEEKRNMFLEDENYMNL